MKKLLIIFSFLVCNNIFSQNHTTHEVKLGETIEEIAKTYMVTPFDIYALNPDIDSKLKPKTQLIIPVSKLLDVPVEVKKEKIDGKIVCIENADPGYDWIFSHNIAGLITKYGGVASHMSIRCAEFDLPAAIGCGEQIFNNLSLATKVSLDCANKKIRCI